ncbi:MAG: DUF1501 domain-containing protein [Planctomycetaceae bacterium]
MSPTDPRAQTRRYFFGRSAVGIGTAALATLWNDERLRASELPDTQLNGLPTVTPKARRVISLFQSGAPSQMDLFDDKPKLANLCGTELPDSIRQGQRLTGMTKDQTSFPVAPSIFSFRQHGDSGAWVSNLLPYTAQIADELCFVKSMYTEAINHDPAITFMQTGAQLAGRPSLGAWLSYGLGTANKDLPTFVAMVSGSGGQPLYNRLWGSGFLATRYAGVRFRSVGDPVLFLSDPPGISRRMRRDFLDDLTALNTLKQQQIGDPETTTRIAQYEMAYRMQTSVPELTDISDEPQSTFDLYGDDARRPGTYAFNCLMARRVCERDVRFVQLFHRGWDQHVKLPEKIAIQCQDTDRASAALVVDLRQRGLLDDTLVMWGGEFGRTVYCQGQMTAADYGRDHHPRCFTVWLAGAGIKPGITYGRTDDFSYNIVQDPVHVHDLNATLLHCLGIDHTQLTFKYQGRHHRLTDVHGNVVRDILI